MKYNKIPVDIIIHALLIIVITIFFLNKASDIPLILFWLITWSAIVFSSLLIIKSKKSALTHIILLALFIAIIKIVSTPYAFQLEKDAIFESQFASTIISGNQWNPLLGKGFAENYYGYYPVIHSLIGFLSITTNINPFLLSKYFIPLLLKVIIISLAYLITLKLTKNYNISNITSLVLLGTISFMQSPVSRRTIASIFILLSLYFLLNKNLNKKYSNFLFYITSIFIVVSDHSISNLFLLFLFLTYIFSIIVRKNKRKEPILYDIGKKFLFLLIIYLLWQIFVANVVINIDLGYAKEIVNTILSGFGLKSFLGRETLGPEIVHINKLYETIIAYLSQLIFLTLGIIGFFIYKKNKENKKSENYLFFLFLSVFGFVGFLISAFLIRTNLSVVSSTYLWFFTVPIAILASFTLINARTKLKKFYPWFLIVTLLILYTGSLIIEYSPKIVNRQLQEDIVLGELRSKSEELYASAGWLNKNTNKRNIIGDPTVFDIYSGFYQFDVASDYETRVIYNLTLQELNNYLYTDVLFGTYKHTRKRDKIDYIIINKAVFDYPSFLFGSPLPKKQAKKFDKSEALNKVYSNGEISIYKNKLN